MENEELYPELIDYIFNYCGKYFWENELKANRHLHALAKSTNGDNIVMYKVMQQMNHISTDQKVLDLAKDGFEVFKLNVVKRIYGEYKGELTLNLCPKCSKVARTPQAQQCRFCLHSWRKKD